MEEYAYYVLVAGIVKNTDVVFYFIRTEQTLSKKTKEWQKCNLEVKGGPSCGYGVQRGLNVGGQGSLNAVPTQLFPFSSYKSNPVSPLPQISYGPLPFLFTFLFFNKKKSISILS